MYVGVSRGAQITGVAVCSLALTWISFAFRIYVRLGILKFMGREDWITVAAMIVFSIFCSLCLRATVYGLGAHIFNISPDSLQTGFKITFVCELLYVVSTTITKLSIAAYFLRLSSKKYQRMVIYITTAVVLLFSTMYFFFLIFQCTPTRYFWTKWIHSVDPNPKCLDGRVIEAVTYAHCAVSAITDWSFGILPVFFVWNMQMNPRTKLSVVLILSLGFFASTATIVRIVYIKTLKATDDYSWEGINLAKWSMIEPAIAITAMNFATLRPMFKNVLRFASKSFDSNDEEAKRPSGESGTTMRTRNSVSAKDYSVEFAELLGLSRVGVTTHISAGGSQLEKDQLRKRFTLRKSMTKISQRNESQTELNAVSPMMPDDGIDWTGGIKATTVVTHDVS
ncbi:related to integral membrane protein [Phialocephala subalpina]|uniref:Related to integral membrane protein n=1 Tax=Phialocephala subalpina TaxID=576137 RepID=A0A1L7XQB4_9HELO|nr:related to integral membrane protein [Phialocephala subalpina]